MKTRLKNTWNLKKLQKQWKAWLTSCKDHLYDGPCKEIQAALGSDCTQVWVNMNFPCEWLATKGALDVLEDKEDGWATLSLAIEYLNWGYCIQAAWFLDRNLPEDGASVDLDQVSLALAHAITVVDERTLSFLPPIMLASLQTTRGVYRSWDPASLTPLVLQLYCRWKNIPFPKSVYKLDTSYQPIWDAWDNEDKFVTILKQACEYHCIHAKDSDAEITEFCWPPFEIYPVEILAILKVRKDLGLSVPDIDHPLMNTALARIPAQIPSLKNELLEQAVSYCREQFPSLSADVDGIVKKLLATASTPKPKEKTKAKPPPVVANLPPGWPDISAWRQALSICEVPEESAEEFAPSDPEGTLWDFTEALSESPFAVVTDWKAEVDFDTFPWMLERCGIDFDAAQRRKKMIVTIKHEGQSQRYEREADDNQYDLMAAVGQILPKAAQLYALKQYEPTDTMMHMVLGASVWAQLRDILGPVFDELFVSHQPSKPFQPARKGK